MIWHCFIELSGMSYIVFRGRSDQSALVSLRRTCHQIDLEVSHVFLASVVFVVRSNPDSQKMALRWLQNVSIHKCLTIQKMILDTDERTLKLLFPWSDNPLDNNEWNARRLQKTRNLLKLLELVPNLRHLKILYNDQDYPHIRGGIGSHSVFSNKVHKKTSELLQGLSELKSLTFSLVHCPAVAMSLATNCHGLGTLKLEVY